jgi:hypothetical protein
MERQSARLLEKQQPAEPEQLGWAQPFRLFLDSLSRRRSSTLPFEVRSAFLHRLYRMIVCPSFLIQRLRELGYLLFDNLGCSLVVSFFICVEVFNRLFQSS